MSVPLPLRHNQQVPSQSVQASNANSPSLNGTFTAVATVVQQIMTELKGAELEEDRILTIKNCIKTREAKWLLGFNCKYRRHVLLSITATNDRPVLSSEKVPHIDKTATV
jgi:hypothetical protein